MSKRRAVVLAVVVEGLSQAGAARRYELSEAAVSRWLARWGGEGEAAVEAEGGWWRWVPGCRDEGEAAFEPKSRRPRSSPNQVPAEVVERIVNLRVELA